MVSARAPLCDRDYRVELGYRIGASWMSLAFSSVARVPALHPSEQILDQFVPFSLEAAPAESAPAPVAPIESSNSGLHERLYQSATVQFRRRRVGSEEFQEGFDVSGDSSGLNDSGLASGPAAATSLALVAWLPANAPSGWWLTPN